MWMDVMGMNFKHQTGILRHIHKDYCSCGDPGLVLDLFMNSGPKTGDLEYNWGMELDTDVFQTRQLMKFDSDFGYSSCLE